MGNSGANPSRKRARDLEKLERFKKALPKQPEKSKSHSRVLEFITSNGIRPLGEPRIGEFANQ